MIYGIDISHYQGDFDLHRTRREGFEFAILKATEGHTYTDPWFARNLDKARSAGLLVAAYHYQREESAASWQADHIEATVPKDCPVILDVEHGGGGVALTRELYAELIRRGFRSPLLYLPAWYWRQIGSPDLSGLPPLWYSRYANYEGGSASAIWNRNAGWFNQFWGGYGGLGVEVLQFTSSATVAGHTPVDANAYRGSRADLATLFGGNGSAYTPALPGGIESMAFTDSYEDWAGNPQTVESWMNHVDRRMFELHRAILGLQQSRIPGDKNQTNAANAIMDSTAWTAQIMGMVAGLQARDGATAAELAEALRPALHAAVVDALGAENAEFADAIVDKVAERLAGDAA